MILILSEKLDVSTNEIIDWLVYYKKDFVRINYEDLIDSENIVAYEITHLIERLYNARFKSILDIHMPGWREIKDELNRFVG